MKTGDPAPTGDTLQKQLAGYRLTTAHILYHIPDYPQLLQEFIWQHLDIAPDFPELKRFLAFWERQIEGRLHSVEIASARFLKPTQLRSADGMFALH